MAGIGKLYALIDQLRRNVSKNAQSPMATLEQGVYGLRDQFRQEPVNTVLGSANIGGGLLGTFVGPKSKVWNKVAADKFSALERKGVSNKDAYFETGTFRAPDGRLRQEIDDSQSRSKVKLSGFDMKDLKARNNDEWIGPDQFAMKYPNSPEAENYRLVNTMRQGKLNDDTPTLDAAFAHDLLFQAYPNLNRTKVAIDDKMPIGDAGYADKQNALIMSPMDESNMRSAMLHEGQHVIQSIEGFSPGGTTDRVRELLNTLISKEQKDANRYYNMAYRNDPLAPVELLKPSMRRKSLASEQEAQKLRNWAGRIDEFGDGMVYDAYRSLAGEAEARATQARMNMTPEQRRASFPLDSYDVPLNQLIIQGLRK